MTAQAGAGGGGMPSWMNYAAGGAGAVGASQFGGQGVNDFMWGTGFEKMDTLSPEQQQLFQQIMSSLGQGGQLGQSYGQGLSGLQEMLNPSSAAYQRFEAPHLQQFEQQTVPGLAERFAGAGAQGGALSSSGFGQALSSAGGQLQTQLAGMKAGLQQQAIRDIMQQYSGMAGMGMGAETFGYQAPKEGAIMKLLAAFAGGAGRGATGGMGG